MTDRIEEDAKKLARYSVTRAGFSLLGESPRHDHFGALLADGILQAGLNYRTVVYPRVVRVQSQYPEAIVLSGVIRILESVPSGTFLSWSHSEKIERFERVVECLGGEVETVSDFCNWVDTSEGSAALLRIHGVGPKTVDYLHRLAGGAQVAIDRHVFRFLGCAGVEVRDYASARLVVCQAADLLGIARDKFDASIWKYMSSRAHDLQGLAA